MLNKSTVRVLLHCSIFKFIYALEAFQLVILGYICFVIELANTGLRGVEPCYRSLGG